MTLESIEKLREQPTWSLGIAQHFADEIQAEIDSRYMELPLDADGVPIRVGDYLHSDETRCDFPCRGYNMWLDGANEKWWTVECCYDKHSGTSEYVSAKSCRHVKPRTVEDVLEEFGEEFEALCKADAYPNPNNPSFSYERELRDLLAKYTVELRLALRLAGVGE